MNTVVWLSDEVDAAWFPPASQALRHPDGLLAAGGELTPTRVLSAYEQGIFPWYADDQPVLWWSPDPRAVLFPDEFKLARSLAKRLRNGGFETRFDSAFATVIRECAAPRHDADGTWLTPQMIAVYTQLHEMGYAHSVETWLDGELVGGLYGIRLGGIFFGESMFSRRPDASKVALARLVERARSLDIVLIDCQVSSEHLRSLGSRSIPREDFLALLRAHARPHQAGRWT